MNNPVSQELIKKYAAGECSPEEEKVIALWLESDSDTETHQANENDREVQQIWEDIHFQIVIPETSVSVLKMPWIKCAVACVLLMSSASVIYLKINEGIDSSRDTNVVFSHKDKFEINMNLEKWKSNGSLATRIYNTSSAPKRIRFSNISGRYYTIQPKRNYILTGTFDRPVVRLDI